MNCIVMPTLDVINFELVLFRLFLEQKEERGNRYTIKFLAPGNACFRCVETGEKDRMSSHEIRYPLISSPFILKLVLHSAIRYATVFRSLFCQSRKVCFHLMQSKYSTNSNSWTSENIRWKWPILCVYAEVDMGCWVGLQLFVWTPCHQQQPSLQPLVLILSRLLVVCLL